MSKIAVIIVTYNGEKYIEKCIKSIYKSTVASTIFMIDNASSDQTVDIAKKFEDIELIVSQTNLGFGKANNIAIKKALKTGFEHLFLLNQDTWIAPNTIENLSENLQNNRYFGILSPLQYSANEVDLDKNFENNYKKGTKKNHILTEIPFINAAAWMVTKSCFENVGFFEPIFSHYGEDRNFCDRAQYHGYKIGIVTNATIVHDRTIIRNYKKDVLQSKYLILNSLININHSFTSRIYIVLKSVFGLPKYFMKYYGFKKSMLLLLELFVYFVSNVINSDRLKKIIKISKAGKNGL